MRNLKYYFRYKLTEKEKSSILKYYESLNFASLEQHPDWYLINNPGKKICFFYAVQDESFVCYSLIRENKKFASILFGPLTIDPDTLIECIVEIRNYYKKKGFGLLSVQLGIPTSQQTDYIEYNLYRKCSFSQHFNKLNWSSISLKLDKDINDIFNNFKSNHKWSIKKAIKLGLKVREINSYEQINQLSHIYDKMYKQRRIIKDFDNTHKVFVDIYNFFQQYNKGIILGVFNNDEKLVGGTINVCHGNIMYFKYGATDPEYRKLPLLHIALYEGIKIAKQKGFVFFDFWGYNHFTDEKEQISRVNFFKKSFSGKFIFYPKVFYFRLNFLIYFLLNIIKFIYKVYQKTKIY